MPPEQGEARARTFLLKRIHDVGGEMFKSPLESCPSSSPLSQPPSARAKVVPHSQAHCLLPHAPKPPLFLSPPDRACILKPFSHHQLPCPGERKSDHTRKSKQHPSPLFPGTQGSVLGFRDFLFGNQRLGHLTGCTFLFYF